MDDLDEIYDHPVFTREVVYEIVEHVYELKGYDELRDEDLMAMMPESSERQLRYWIAKDFEQFTRIFLPHVLLNVEDLVKELYYTYVMWVEDDDDFVLPGAEWNYSPLPKS